MSAGFLYIKGPISWPASRATSSRKEVYSSLALHLSGIHVKFDITKAATSQSKISFTQTFQKIFFTFTKINAKIVCKFHSSKTKNCPGGSIRVFS